MFWRRRSNDFEWHKYVRTTIKLRREDRRRRLDDMKGAAARGLKDAGSYGVTSTIGWLDVLIRYLGTPVVWLGQAVRVIGRALAQMLRIGLRYACSIMASAARLMQHDYARKAVLLTAAFLALVALGRLTAGNFDGFTQGLLVGASVLVLLLVIPPVLTRHGPTVADWLRPRVSWLAARVGRLSLPRPPPRLVARAVAGVLVLAFAGGAFWLGYRSTEQLPDLSALTTASLPAITKQPTLVGRAIVMSGDSFRIAGRTVQLAGIEAPEAGQRCGARRRRWRCGTAARNALRALVKGKTVHCALRSDRKGSGHSVGNCQIAGNDVAAELVSKGHVFSEPGLFATYGRLEMDARNAKAGIWRDGLAERPGEYRARLWERAKRRAPSGCPIKGYVRRGKRLYVTPWEPGYRRTRVRQRRGGRWFCNEAEAIAAGWQPKDRS